LQLLPREQPLAASCALIWRILEALNTIYFVVTLIKFLVLFHLFDRNQKVGEKTAPNE